LAATESASVADCRPSQPARRPTGCASVISPKSTCIHCQHDSPHDRWRVGCQSMLVSRGRTLDRIGSSCGTSEAGSSYQGSFVNDGSTRVCTAPQGLSGSPAIAHRCRARHASAAAERLQLEEGGLRWCTGAAPTVTTPTVPNGAAAGERPAEKLRPRTKRSVTSMSHRQCAAVSTCRGLTSVPEHQVAENSDSSSPVHDVRGPCSEVVGVQSVYCRGKGRLPECRQQPALI
jgi:hypothetical protein